jgi:hypothetical protein
MLQRYRLNGLRKSFFGYFFKDIKFDSFKKTATFVPLKNDNTDF